MTNLTKLIVLAALTGLVTFPVLAAEATAENQAQELPETEQSDTNNAASGDSAPDSGSDSDEALEEESPSRFIPTEQISQDLGVSFPVDI